MSRRLMQRFATPLGLLILTFSGCSKKEAPAPVAAEGRPVEAKPAEAKPAEDKPEAKPEDKPAEVKPAEAPVAPAADPPGGAPTDAVGKALSAAPVAQVVGDKTLTASWCKLPGDGLIGKSASSVLRALEVVGDRLYVVDGDGAIHGYVLATANGCELTVDSAFGEGGTLKLPRKVEHLSKSDAGTLFAGGIFETYALKDGKQAYACKATGHFAVDPGGSWAIVPWINSTVEIAELSDSGCTPSDWVLRDLSKDDVRVGPYKSVMASAIIDGKIYLGAVPAEKLDGGETRVIAITDKAGKELGRFGPATSDEARFGWVNGISACGANVCVVDGNYRRMTMWTRDGKYLGFVNLLALFGLAGSVAWNNDIATGPDGAVYLPAAQTREGVKVAEALIFRVTGF